MKIVFLALIFLLSTNQLVFNAQASAVADKSDLAVALQHLTDLKGFSCQFKQVLSYAEGGERVYTGNLAVSRPSKFRWQYLKPYVQLYVGNGSDIWLYEPDLMQVQHLQDLGEVEPVVMQLLDGRIGLEDVQVLASEALDGNETSWFVAVGKGAQAVKIDLGTQAGNLLWIESRDALGNRNRLYLLEVNEALPAWQTFEFNAPEGVDIIGVSQ
ncbi:MAG: outer-membrane lipoprotein carrier protein LolA [Ghiorsea sp.]